MGSVGHACSFTSSIDVPPVPPVGSLGLKVLASRRRVGLRGRSPALSFAVALLESGYRFGL